MSRDTEDKLQDLATYGVSFSKRGQRIDPRDVYISTEPEQEPVAWMSINNNGGISIDNYYANHKDYVPLYLAPQKREPLNIEEIHNGLDGNNGYDDRFVDGVRFAEKAHGIGGGE